MRTGLIAAQSRTVAGDLRAQLRLVGRSVLAWQVDLLLRMGAERIICLCDGAAADILPLQHQVEAAGGSFHAINGFAALPALVRDEDVLIVLRDGLVPDPAVVTALFPQGAAMAKGVLCLPDDHPLAHAQPAEFERIDAARLWAGLFVMRGGPAQHLADFPADADAISVLLRLALQAGTPCRILTAEDVTAATWLVAESDAAVRGYETALIAKTAPRSDWRAPSVWLAAGVIRIAASRWIGQGAMISAAFAMAALLGGVVAAAWGAGAAGLALSAIGAFGAEIATGFSAMNGRLKQGEERPAPWQALGGGVVLFAALTVWFVLSPWPDITPLAICGPITIGLARLAAREDRGILSIIASDRASLLMVLAVAAVWGLAASAIAVLGAILLGALLLNPRQN